MLRSLDLVPVQRRSMQIAIALCLLGGPLHAVVVDPACPAMPQELRTELEARSSALFAGAGTSGASIRLECNATGVWMVWFDGSRALVDQSKGFVPGALALIEGRLVHDRQAASSTSPAAPAPPALMPTPSPATAGSEQPVTAELTPWGPDDGPPGEDVPPESAKSSRDRGAQGGLGLAMMTEFWSGTDAVGTGPRLDVSIALPGPFALLIGEGALFGVGAPSSAQMVMFDLQAGVGWGAPFRSRTGLGLIALVGTERMAATGGRGNASGLWQWTALFDVGARGSLAVGSTNLWLGADLILRTDEFQAGRPNPITIPTTSFLASIGCFLPAFGQGTQVQ